MKEYSETSCRRLLRKAQKRLAATLDALVGKEVEPEVTYLLYGAQHMARIVAGYCELRFRHRGASKIMVRPALEMMFSFAAVLSNPEFLFRKAHHEYQEARKLIDEHEKIIRKRAIDPNERDRLVASLSDERRVRKEDFETFEAWFKKERSKCPAQTVRWKAAQAAEAAGLGDWYGQYRTYCQFTHGAVQAIDGSMDTSTDPADSRVMLWLTLITLELIRKSVAIEIPELDILRKQARGLLE